MSHISEHCITIILNIVSLIVVIIGGIFAFVQWRKSLKLKKAEYIKELIDKIRSDSEIRDIIYTFDYAIPWYNRNFHGSETEKKTDKTLLYFSYICYLRDSKTIGEKEFNFFEYEIKRFMNNSDLQDYFYNIYHFSNKNNSPMSFI